MNLEEDMQAVMQVVQLRNGHYAVRSIGGSTLNTTLAEFATQVEAEEWMLHRTMGSRSDSAIMRPGDSSAVA